MEDELKSLGIFLKSSGILEMAYNKYRGLAMLPLSTTMNIMILDLDNLPVKPFKFKEVFIRWMLQMNEGRIMNGEEPILTYNLAKRCPIWKICKMPIKSAGISKDSLLKPPSLKTVSRISQPKNINK